MNRDLRVRSSLTVAGGVALLLLVVVACRAPGSGSDRDHASRRPNVILIMTDDQGYGDVAAHGNPVLRTPNLDRLHGESVRLTDYHVDPTCSPTRSALMTGRYSTRTGVWHTIMGRSLMASEEVTLGEVFQASGYRTAMFGKWHLGDNHPCRPQDQGFDHVVWHRGGGVTQGPDHWGNDYFDDTYVVNGAEREFPGFCTDVWFDQAMEFIDAQRDAPFFVYLATNTPHLPWNVDERWSQPYLEQGVPGSLARFYGTIENIDWNVGRLRARLEALGLAEDTLLIFTADNGTAAPHGMSREEREYQFFNAGMRDVKGSVYEGGHRVPMFWHWPAGGLTGGRDEDTLSAHIDVLPTLVELAELEPPAGPPLDGLSLALALPARSAPPRDRVLLVHSQRIEHPRKGRRYAVMTGVWRLVNGEELYDIESDPGQTQDCAAEHPGVVTRLRDAYEEWWRSLEPSLSRTVRITVGGPVETTRLMSHDWHTDDGPVPWHQVHVERGQLASGFWALDVQRAGTYEVTLYRWPAHLGQAMDCVHASIDAGEVHDETAIPSDAASATFRVNLGAGPLDLRTTLRRSDGQEHGAYFAEVRRVAGA